MVQSRSIYEVWTPIKLSVLLFWYLEVVIISNQWRPEGLQRPGANAWIGAPPPFGKSCIRPWGEKTTSKKKKKVFSTKK